MAERRLVSEQTLPSYSVSERAKLTFSQDVVERMAELFPPELQITRKAKLIVFYEDPNGNVRPLDVITSLQKQGQNGWRVVLLESRWKLVVRELGLRERDTVRIFLLDNPAWTYSIEVERAPRMPFDLNVPPQPDMEINPNQSNGPEADEVNAMDEDGVPEEAPARRDIDLNEPAQPDVEINLNQPNHPVEMEFDLNEPAHPYVEINLNDEE